MRIEFLCFLALLLALVSANGRQNLNYESYQTFPGINPTWTTSQWSSRPVYSTPGQVNYYSSGQGASSRPVDYYGYGRGQSWSSAGTGLDSGLYNGGRWQGSNGFFGGYGAGSLNNGIDVQPTYTASTRKRVLQGSGLRFGAENSGLGYLGGVGYSNNGVQYNGVASNGYSTIIKDVFGVSPVSKYGINGAYGAYGRGSGWNSGSFFAPGGVKPMYGDVSSIYGQNQVISGASKLIVPSYPGVSNLYADGKWSNRGVYAGYGDGLDYYWKWRKNGFQPFNAAPVGTYSGYQSGNLVTGVGSIPQYLNSGSLSGSAFSAGPGSGSIGLLSSPQKLNGNIAATNNGIAYGFSGSSVNNAAYNTKPAILSSFPAGGIGLLNTANKFSSFNSGGNHGPLAAGIGNANGYQGSNGLASGSGSGSYIYSALNSASSPATTSNLFNVYGTKLNAVTVPAVASNTLGAYVSGKYQNGPYNTAGIYPMYTQSKWTTDRTGQQTGYYTGYGSNSGAYYRPTSLKPSYAGTLTGATPFLGQTSSYITSAKFPSTTGIIGSNGFSSNLYNDGKWNNKGVYAGYGNGIDWYWNWRNNGFKGATGPSGSYITGSYDGLYEGNYGNKYNAAGFTATGSKGNGVYSSGSTLASTPSLANGFYAGYTTGKTPLGSIYSSRKPVINNFSYNTDQYNQQSVTPSIGVSVFGINGNKFQNIASPSTVLTGFSRPLNNNYVSGSYSSVAPQVTSNVRPFTSSTATAILKPVSSVNTLISGTGSLNTIYKPSIPAGTYTTTGNFNLGNGYQTSGITPMYTQSKWTLGNGYYGGYGQYSGTKYTPTSYRPGYISTLSSFRPGYTNPKYTTLQNGLSQVTPASFPSTSGIIGSAGFSSNLYNDGRWSNRGTYPRYGSGLDNYWRWGNNVFQGAGSGSSGIYGGFKGTYNNNYASTNQPLISGNFNGFTNGRLGVSNTGQTFGTFVGTNTQGLSKPVSYGSSLIGGSGSLNTIYRPSVAAGSYGTSGSFNLGNGYVASGITPMYSQSKWTIGNGYYGGYGQYSGSKYAPTSYRPGYVSTLSTFRPSYAGSKFSSGLSQLTPASFPATSGTVGSNEFASNLYNNGKWSNRGTYYGYGNGLKDYWSWRKNGFQGAGSALNGNYGGFEGVYNNKYTGITQSPTVNILSGVNSVAPIFGETVSGFKGSGLNAQKVAGITTPFWNTARPSYSAQFSQSNTYTPSTGFNFFSVGVRPNKLASTIDGSLSSSINKNNIFAPSIATLVNSLSESGTIKGPLPAFGSAAYGAYIPSRYQNRPYSTSGIIPMYSQSKWTVGGIGQGSGYYAGYGTNDGAAYSFGKYNPNYYGGKYSGNYQAGNYQGSFASRPSSSTLNLYGGTKWNNNGVYSGYAKNPSSFWSKFGGGLTGFRPSGVLNSYNNGIFSNNYNTIGGTNAALGGKIQGQFSTSTKLPASFAANSLNNYYYDGSSSNRPGFNSMYSGNKWLFNNGGQNTGIYYGYGSPNKYPSKYQTIVSGSVQSVPAAFTYGNQEGLYNNADWRYNGIYSGYGSGLESYWRWRKSGFVGSGGKGSNAFTGSILGTLHGSTLTPSLSGQAWQGGNSWSNGPKTGNSWSNGHYWNGPSSQIGNIKISQWSSDNNPKNW